jgi:pimeloyl-ACP methyl ester carboxylesterase
VIVSTAYKDAPTETIAVGGTRFAYRRLGAGTGVPVIFLHHLGAVLDNWDPRVIDGIAARHRVIAFDNRGIGASKGSTPTSVAAMARDAVAFIRAMGFDEVDLLGFSLGGFVAQVIAQEEPQLVRKLVLAGTGPAGGDGIDKVTPITLRAMVSELPARVRFRTVPSGSFRLGSAEIEAALVNHRGPTLGYRVTDGDAVLAYIPDHEPALGQDLERDPCESISGLALARNASLLIHDAQYTAEEYVRTRGRGHSTLHDALAFARRAEAEQVALFHHDPAHDDARLDAMAAEAADAWSPRVGDPGGVFVARERDGLELSTVRRAFRRAA